MDDTQDTDANDRNETNMNSDTTIRLIVDVNAADVDKSSWVNGNREVLCGAARRASGDGRNLVEP